MGLSYLNRTRERVYMVCVGVNLQYKCSETICSTTTSFTDKLHLNPEGVVGVVIPPEYGRNLITSSEQVRNGVYFTLTQARSPWQHVHINQL